jgi:hypothetical protein
MIPRHKVFISCYYAEDHYYKEALENLAECTGIFIDQSVREYDIDDTGLTSEQIRRIIRDYYIRDSSVTIVICGPETRRRKHVDWEIHATMYDSPVNHRGGLLVINTPQSSNCTLSAPGDEYLIPGSYRYREYHDQDWLEDHFPDLPDRLFFNIMEGAPISVVNWYQVMNSWLLSELIDNAYVRRNDFDYLTDLPLRKRNS